MEIEIYTNANGRQPYTKWYNGLDHSVRKIIDKQLEWLRQQDFSSDNNLTRSISHLRNNSRTEVSQQVDHLYELHVREHVGKMRLYFGVIDNKIVLLHGGEKDDQLIDLPMIRNKYLDYIDQQRPPMQQIG